MPGTKRKNLEGLRYKEIFLRNLREVYQIKGRRKMEFCRATGMSENHFTKLYAGNCALTLDAMERLCRELDVDLIAMLEENWNE